MKTKLTIALLALLTLTAVAQPTNPIIELPENPPTPVKETVSVLSFFANTATNWLWATYGIYDSDTKSFGAGLAAAYELNPYMFPTIRLDWVNGEWWRPSGSFTMQYPIKVAGGKLTLYPFGFGGIATPIGGQGEVNGRITEIYGAGLAVKLPDNKWINAIVLDWEMWKDHPQYRFGVVKRF